MYFILTDINDFVFDGYGNRKCKCKSGINYVDGIIFSSIDMCSLLLSETPKGFVYIRFILPTNDIKKKISGTILPKYNNGKALKYNIYYKVICSDKYYIYDLGIIKKINCKIDTFFVIAFCKDNIIELLEWWKNASKWRKNTINILDYNYEYSFTIASKYGNTDVLEWLKNSGLPLKYNNSPIDLASRNGHVNVLEWWKNSGLELKYSEQSLSFFDDKYYYIDVLEWWKNSRLNMLLFQDSMDFASKNGHIEVLEWWLKSNLPLDLCYSKDSMIYASENVHIDVLDWWINSKLPLKYSIESLELEMYDIPVLEWWENSGLLDQ